MMKIKYINYINDNTYYITLSNNVEIKYLINREEFYVIGNYEKIKLKEVYNNEDLILDLIKQKLNLLYK